MAEKPGFEAKKPRKALTAAGVQAAKPGSHYDLGRNGLRLVVSPLGAKRWEQRLFIHGKRCDLGLGSAEFVTLAKARELAFENRRIARGGGDPRQVECAPAPESKEAKPKAKAAMTFADAMEEFLKIKLQEFENEKHRRQWRATLDAYAVPIIGKLAVAKIGMAEVKSVLAPLWSTKTETASRLRGRIENVLAWATVHGHRTGDNPARWKGNLDQALPKAGKVAKAGNWPAISLDDAASWFKALRKREGQGARALEFLTLTAARSGEVRGARWSEIDLDRGLWTVPAERMKMNREHRVAMPAAAVALLRSLPTMKDCDLIFFAPKGGMLSDMSVSAVMRRMHESEIEAERPGWKDPRSGKPSVPHGLRSTFRDWSAEAGIERDLAEICLAHAVGSEVERAYRRSDMLERRRDVMSQWAAFLGC